MSAGIIAANDVQEVNVGDHVSCVCDLCKPRNNIFIFPHDCICRAV